MPPPLSDADGCCVIGCATGTLSLEALGRSAASCDGLGDGSTAFVEVFGRRGVGLELSHGKRVGGISTWREGGEGGRSTWS